MTRASTRVLYNDGRNVLIKICGSRHGTVLSEWVPSFVVHYTVCNRDIVGGKTVWNSGPDEQGRLTANRLRLLIISLKLDPELFAR